MKKIELLLSNYYEEFKGLPSINPIVRNNQLNDAFELVVLKILYGKTLPFEINKNHINDISTYIIAPPDSGIDIFVEKENGDEFSYDVIQVKYTELTEDEIRKSIVDMKRTIEDYCKNPKLINSENCKEVLGHSSLDKSSKNNCEYYVVHTGKTKDFAGSNENEHVITITDLMIINNNITDNVESDCLHIDTYMPYGDIYSKDKQSAIVCSINGYDLAKLNNLYYSTEIGRNILFGHNLREALNSRKSKTYRSMENTIKNCPENFWYYNNGITIIAEGVETGNNKITLSNFSIVNGAQTTSSLGLFLKEAEKNKEYDLIEALKNVYVLARVLIIPQETTKRDIAIYNNTQNPITSRDMVANREEQKKLNQWLLNDEFPQIYVEIRRGAQIPNTFNKGFAHRKTTNEELAQLAYASFFQKPFTAKDKKSALFNNDYTQSDFVINKIYHDIFNYDESKENCGILFKKSKAQIDEALFVQHLYKEAKKYLKKVYQERIATAEIQKANEIDIENIKNIEGRINVYSTQLETVGICMFYFVALYYEFKAQFGGTDIIYNYDKYYSDKTFKSNLISAAANLFLTLTIKILTKTATAANRNGNINNWVRCATCERDFFEALREEIATDMDLQKKYESFVQQYKV